MFVKKIVIECSYYAQRWSERYYHNQVKWQQTNLPCCCWHLFFEKQFGFTMRRSVTKDNFPTIVHSQLCWDGLNNYSDNSWKDSINARSRTFQKEYLCWATGDVQHGISVYEPEVPITSFHLLNFKVTFAKEEQEIGGIVTRLPPHRVLQDSP